MYVCVYVCVRVCVRVYVCVYFGCVGVGRVIREAPSEVVVVGEVSAGEGGEDAQGTRAKAVRTRRGRGRVIAFGECASHVGLLVPVVGSLVEGASLCRSGW